MKYIKSWLFRIRCWFDYRKARKHHSIFFVEYRHQDYSSIIKVTFGEYLPALKFYEQLNAQERFVYVKFYERTYFDEYYERNQT